MLPGVTKEVNTFLANRNDYVIPSDVADIPPIDLNRWDPKLGRELPAQLPKIRIGIFAPLLTVYGYLNVKLFPVQLVILPSEISVELEGEPLLSSAGEGDVGGDSSLHWPLLSSCSCK